MYHRLLSLVSCDHKTAILRGQIWQMHQSDVVGINAVNSGSESWTGIGVVAGCGATVLMMQRPHVKHVDTH